MDRSVPERSTQPYRGYCIPCMATRELRDAKEIERAGGPAVEGTCIVCGKTVFVLGAGTKGRSKAPASE